MRELIGIDELARRLSIAKGTIYNLVYQRRIPFLKICRCLRFDVQAIEEFLRQRATAEKPDER